MTHRDETTSDSTEPTGVTDPEDRGAPVAESHVIITERDGTTRIDIADDAQMRPGPGSGQPEADGE